MRTPTFFSLLYLTLLMQPGHGTVSGDGAKIFSLQDASPKPVENVVIPKETSLVPGQMPPFLFHNFPFPHYHFPLTPKNDQSPPSIPRPPTSQESPSWPPPPLPEPMPPPVTNASRPGPSTAPPASSIGVPEHTRPGSYVAPPPPVSGSPVSCGRTPHWPCPSPFPLLQHGIRPWLHPRLFPRWVRLRIFAPHPYLLHPRPFRRWPVPGSSVLYPSHQPIGSNWPCPILKPPPMQNAPPVQRR